MTPKERFRATCRFGPVDRPFRWETIGYWPETIERWHAEGLPEEIEGFLAIPHFEMDMRIPILLGGSEDPGFFPLFEEQILEETDAHRVKRNVAGIVLREFKNQQSALPQFLEFPVTDLRSFDALRWRLDPSAAGRLGENFAEHARSYRDADLPVYVYMCGLFGLARHLLGFENLMFAYRDMPELLHAIGAQWVTLHTGLLEQITAATAVDAVYLWEDMAYRNGPMISPATFRTFMSPYYKQVIDCGRALGIEVFEVDTDGNFSLLIPLFLEAGVNMFLPFEVQAGMDVCEIRARYGKRLIIEGGLDKRALAQDFNAIRVEVEAKVPALLREGGYIPAIDHNVPPDVPLKNFEFFLRCVRNIVPGK
jgi:uroporphyrinogen-III decarboxylase